MEDYRLEQSGQEVQNILNGAAMQTDLTAENERAELAEQTLQGNIDDEALARENADIELQGHIDDEETRAKAAEKQNADDIDAIEEKIPTQASSSNQLADKDYVEDLVSTSSATFRGTFNLVSDLHLTVDASYTNIAAALGNAIAGADNNDFAFVMIPTSVDTPNEIARIEKYKFNGSVWGFEYVLNNSGFTAAQWAAINSGITSALVTKLGALPSAADLAAALLAKQDKLTFDQAPMPSSTNPVTSGGVYTAIDDEKGARINADAALQQAIEAILLLIPSAATALNQLADKDFVNSSITTTTATFRGTFNLVSDLQLTVDATHTDIAAALLNAISTADNNDYVFVQIPTSVDTPTEIRVTERYKFNGTSWQYEYDLNNSGFTAAQWEAINSGITALLVTKLSNLPNATELAAMFAGKQNVLTFDNAPAEGSNNPVKSGGLYDLFAAIDAKMPTGASANNKLVAEDRLAAYVGGIIGALDATFDLTSADGHVTLRMTQTDGVIASLQILTSDIASASALATLGGRVSTNETDIANLQAAYAGLTQSDVIVGTLPSSGQQQNIIYRQPDPDHTPPQFYSDYMWNGSSWVLMATYNNAIDPRPKKGSQNLVTSGGVFDNMGALDVSELNATENPHTLATYADLSAALAAIPSDYQKGGMSIKYVLTSDNKYVQFRCKSNSFTTNTDEWINIEDNLNDLEDYTSEVIGYPQKSINLENFEKRNGLINNGVWALLDNSSYKHIFLPVKGGQKYRFVAATPYNKIEYAFLTSTTEAEGEAPDYCEGYSDVITRQAPQYDVLIPDDCNYLYVYAQGGPVITLPTSCALLASDGSIQKEIDNINSDISSINTTISKKLSIEEQSLTTQQKETTLNNVGVSDTDSFFDLFKTAGTGYSEMVINSTISGKFITSSGALSDYALYNVRVYNVSGIDKIYIKEKRNSIELARVYAFYSDAECTSVVGEVGPAYSTLEIDLEIDVPAGANYIGVSYRENVTSLYKVLQGDKTTLLKTIIRIAESSSQVFGICKISKWYFHFVRKNGGKYIIREFLNEGINNLFFLEAIHIGHITDEGVVIESTIQEAYRTDNIGPVMISNPVLFPGEDGGWSGGAHGKTIDNVEYPTAEQDSLSILCDGVSVSENGMYFGEVTITAKNKLYFPESITGDNLSSATLALNERIEIVLNEKMNVRVIEEAASNDVYISRYYGLQGIRIGFNEMYLLGNNLHITFADMATDLYLSQPERKIMMYNNNLHYDLTLKDIGLGMLNNTSRHYYGFFPVSARKVYFMLIDTYGGVQPYVLESGKVIGWEGVYDVYFD